MIGQKRDLWHRLREYSFDNLVTSSVAAYVTQMFGGPRAARAAFADKLVRKLGWHREFALRAIEEYKRFVYLGVVSDFPVTPSKVIDQVWHEHLLFTRGYAYFCNNVLRRPFDHNPELVPVDEQTEMFRTQYHDTLDLYVKEFGVQPPAEIWSATKFGSRIAKGSDPESDGHQQRRKRRQDRDSDTCSYTPQDGDRSQGGHHSNFEGYGGGKSGGAGASAFWDDWTPAGSGEATATDSGGDGGSAGGDGGDGGGSGCSSGCGGD